MKKLAEKKEIEKDLKLLAKSSVIVFIGLFLSKVFTYVYRIIIAREFGPETYGFFTIAVMITGWFIAFSNIGLNQGLVRYVAIFRIKNQKSKISYLFKVSLIFTAITSIAAGILLFLLAPFISLNLFHNSDLIIFLKFFSLIISLTVISEIYLSVVLAYEYIGWYTFIYKVLLSFLRVLIIAGLVYLGLKTNAIFLSYTLSLLLILIFSFYLCKNKFSFLFDKRLPKSQAKALFRKLFYYSWPLLFYAILWNTFHWTDSFFIGYFKNAYEVGIYNAAVPIAFLLTMTSSLFMQLFFPMINREYSLGNKETVKQLSQQVGKWIFALNIPLTILFILYPQFFLNLLFGPDYLSAANSLRFLAVGTLFFSLFDVSNKLITMGGRSKVVLSDILVVFVGNITLDILLIPRYGIEGAAFATMISLILLSLIFAVQSFIFYSILPIRRKIINISIATGISTVILIYLTTKFPSGILYTLTLFTLFFILYLISILLLQGFDKNDKMIFKIVLRKLEVFKN